MKHDRQETDIVVNVIDFSEIGKKVIAEYKEADLDVEVSFTKTGYIEVNGKKYVLDFDGVMSTKPISARNPWGLGYSVTEKASDFNKGRGRKVWFKGMDIGENDITKVSEKENLADFIRVFGSRLEYNYKGVIDFVNELRDKALA